MKFYPFQVIQGGRTPSENARPALVSRPGQSRTQAPDAPDSPGQIPDDDFVIGLPEDVEAKMKAFWGPDSAGQGPDDPGEFWDKYGHLFIG